MRDAENTAGPANGVSWYLGEKALNIQGKPELVLYSELPTSTCVHTWLPKHVATCNFLEINTSKYTSLIKFTLYLRFRGLLKSLTSLLHPME